MLAKIENGVVTEWNLGERTIRSANPNVSFSFPLKDEVLTSFGYVRFEHTDKPEHDVELHDVNEVTPIIVNGVAVQQWEKVEKFTAEEKTAFLAEKDANELIAKKQIVRNQRNELLQQSDWTQLPDAGVDANAWATYRQALRDIPEQEGFPHDVTFPTKPE